MMKVRIPAALAGAALVVAPVVAQAAPANPAAKLSVAGSARASGKSAGAKDNLAGGAGIAAIAIAAGVAAIGIVAIVNDSDDDDSDSN